MSEESIDTVSFRAAEVALTIARVVKIEVSFIMAVNK